jgi:hypothetical protein
MVEHEALAAFNACVARGDVAGAEPHAAALAALRPGNVAVLEAALACNRGLGRADRAAHFARALLAVDATHLAAHLALLDGPAGTGELASRTCVALAPAGAIHPLRRLHEAHRAISLHLLEPHAKPAPLAALVAAARGVDPGALPEGEARHWARHYRHLAEAADPDLLPRTPRQTARRTRAVEAELAFVVAADAAYLRLYGRAYLTSILRHCDVPALVNVHVIGGRRALPDLVRMLDMHDPRLRFTADDFAADAITTQCHDSDGPRRIPVAHLQCVRFAVARRVMREWGVPVIVSDIDVVLQRGVADMLARFADADIVLNRNEVSESFGSHITANLLLAQPTPAGHAFLARLDRYLAAALAAPHVTRWIDQCGLQACWNASDARFGWFDTGADINNVMYPRYAPNPFRFLSLFHGFDMSSLPDG